MTQRRPLPDKLFFKIGEAADIIGVKAHVLRYWESEFRSLKPLKTRGAHRVYRRQDVELALRIRTLIEQEGYSIQGAKKKLRDDGVHEEVAAVAVAPLGWRAELLAVRTDLSKLLDAFNPTDDDYADDLQEQLPFSDSVLVPAHVNGHASGDHRI